MMQHLALKLPSSNREELPLNSQRSYNLTILRLIPMPESIHVGTHARSHTSWGWAAAAALLNAGALPFLALIFFGGGTPLSESEDESSEELLSLSEDGELDESELEELSAQAP